MSSERFTIEASFVARENQRALAAVEEDYEALARTLRRRGLNPDALLAQASAFAVAIPSWGVGTGGTRFARFAGIGEPRDIYEKLEDCATVQQLVRSTPSVSLHIPWDEPEDLTTLRQFATARGLGFDAMNSNTFQDQPGQRLSYKHGSLTHPDPRVRAQAVEHNLHCIDIGRALGSTALTVWIGDGGNFPGQIPFRKAMDRYLDSARDIYAALPDGWRMFLEHKLFEPAFYATVINDWGTSYACATALGPKAMCLVDLGHHAPNVNIEMIVARLAQLGKLGGFHFNDSKYGDDDLDAGSIKPFQLFLIFHELVCAQRDGLFPEAPAYMLDQSHNVTDPLESLMTSAVEVTRAYVQALLVDHAALTAHQERCDATMALATLKQAFTTDVSPLLALARLRAGGALDPVAVYRASGYRQRKAEERPPRGGAARSGIV